MKICIFIIVVFGGCNTFFDTKSVEFSTTGSDVSFVDADTNTTDTIGDVPNSVDLIDDVAEVTECDGDCACEASCVCRQDCSVTCASGCDVECSSSLCEINASADGAGFTCQSGATCNVACVGECELICTDKTAECYASCPPGSSCLAFCGTARKSGPPNERLPCEILDCNSAPIDCGGGMFVCGRSCP